MYYPCVVFIRQFLDYFVTRCESSFFYLTRVFVLRFCPQRDRDGIKVYHKIAV